MPRSPHSAFAATIMKVNYDYDVQGENDPYIDIAEKGLEGFNIAANPGRFYVDIFPIRQSP